MKTNLNVTKIILISLVAILILCFFVYCSKSVEMKQLDCIAVDEQTGYIAIAYYTTAAKVDVFDSKGNLIFSKVYDTPGKGIHNMLWKDGQLYFKMGGNTVLVDSEGNIVANDPNIEFPITWRDDWEKYGGAYKKYISGVEYRYDQASLFEYLGTPVDRIYINDGESEKCIWDSTY